MICPNNELGFKSHSTMWLALPLVFKCLEDRNYCIHLCPHSGKTVMFSGGVILPLRKHSAKLRIIFCCSTLGRACPASIQSLEAGRLATLPRTVLPPPLKYPSLNVSSVKVEHNRSCRIHFNNHSFTFSKNNPLES